MITLVIWAAFFILGLMFAIWDSWGCEVTISPNCVNLFVHLSATVLIVYGFNNSESSLGVALFIMGVFITSVGFQLNHPEQTKTITLIKKADSPDLLADPHDME